MQAVVSKPATPQVFQAGRPVDRQVEAFVPRDAVLGQIEQQVMLVTGCPGLVLYGRQRTGKSTALYNLAGFLDENIIPTVISMQDAQVSLSQEAFLHRVAEVLRQARIAIAAILGDLSAFYDLLTRSNEWLAKAGKRLLVAIDEYEVIDDKIKRREFEEDLLRTIRASIQTHRNITWIFGGSHEIAELTAAPWTSYLVSARTIHVPMFELAETRLLLTEPFKHATRFGKEHGRRPRFKAGFWGEGGIERIHEEAGGWPELVRLIAETIIDLINDEAVHAVNPGLFERALDNCVTGGTLVLYQLMHGEDKIEYQLEAEWEYLSAFRRHKEQIPPQDEAVYRSLRRRELVTEENGYWRLRVPLMSRWLRQRG